MAPGCVTREQEERVDSGRTCPGGPARLGVQKLESGTQGSPAGLPGQGTQQSLQGSSSQTSASQVLPSQSPRQGL